MGTKADDRCLAKVADDEPIFVLRAQDVTAPWLVRVWVDANPQLSEDRAEEARELARRMEAWPHRKLPD